jgi:hypothetical protein
MIEHICENCIYKYEPKSVRDYYEKAYFIPQDLSKWNNTVFKHRFWLCGNPHIARINKVNNSIVYKPCIEYNFNGNCTFFKKDNAIDILPSTVSISEPTEPIYMGDKAELEVIVTPFTTPAITETKTEKRIDENGDPILDDDGNEIYDTVTVEIESEFVNDQEINCSYIWYKNGRKLYQKKSPKLLIDTSTEAVDEYYCKVVQSIADNGDGGNKTVEVNSNTVVITVNLKEDTETT